MKDEDREDKVTELKKQIERGEYRVDATAVADAVIRRLRELADARADCAEFQKECSYPARSTGPSRKAIPHGPSRTAPTRVRLRPRRRLGVMSGLVHAAAGTHTQSS
jgi:hypothetical protein